jgi:DNA repair exonuclease SbcCD ATPase subunit
MVSAKKIIDSDFPNYINSRACIQLEDSINRFFEYVKKGLKIKIALDKKGVVLTYKANNEPSWMPITMVSGFESSLVSIGFKVAVANAFGSEILILDEPDGPADETSSELLFNQLSSIKGFKQVFVITHKPSAMDKLKESGATVWSVEAGKFSIV